MHIVTLVAACGGVGRSTLVATLADLIRRRGRAVLALDLDPANALALHLGASRAPWRGLATLDADGHSEGFAAALQNSDGVQFVPCGQLDAAAQRRFENRLADDPQWLRAQLARIALPADALVLVDTPRLPSPLTTHALQAADLALAVLAPDAASFAALPQLEAAPARALRYVVNGLEPNRPLQNDVRVLLREALGTRLAPVAIYRDGCLPDAQARNRALLDDAPYAQAAQDLQQLCSWLLRSVDELAE